MSKAKMKKYNVYLEFASGAKSRIYHIRATSAEEALKKVRGLFGTDEDVCEDMFMEVSGDPERGMDGIRQFYRKWQGGNENMQHPFPLIELNDCDIRKRAKKHKIILSDKQCSTIFYLVQKGLKACIDDLLDAAIDDVDAADNT